MSIQGKLGRVIEANRISGVKAYGEYDYNERDVRGLRNTNTRVQELMAQSVETGRKLDKLLAKNWVQGHDEFIGKLLGENDE